MKIVHIPEKLIEMIFEVDKVVLYRLISNVRDGRKNKINRQKSQIE